MMLEALASLMAAITARTIRTDISATDMYAILSGIALTSGKPDQREQAESTSPSTDSAPTPTDGCVVRVRRLCQ